MTQEEISNLQALNKSYQQIFNELGKTTIKIEFLKKDEEHLIKAYNAAFNKQQELLKSIKEKYGNVSINLETWELEIDKA